VALASPPPPDCVGSGRDWGTPDPAPCRRWSSPPPAGVPRRRCTYVRVGAASGGRPDGRRRRSVGPPPRPAWQRRWVRSGRPVSRWGRVPRSGAPRAAPRTEAPRVCAPAPRLRRVASAAHARTHRRRRLSRGAAARRALAPSATSTRGMRGLLLAPRGWERVNTAWGGGRRLPRSPRWSTVLRLWSARRRWREGDCAGLLWWPPCGVGEKGVEKRHVGSVGVARQWRGVGGLVSERRCPFVRAHPQKMLVTLWSIFRHVKTILSLRKSRVFSRTRFQYPEDKGGPPSNFFFF